MAREEINGRREEQLSSSSVTEFSLAWKVKEQREVSATAARWSLQACFSGAEEGRRQASTWKFWRYPEWAPTMLCK